MNESLTTLAAPYGGAPFLAITALAVLSLGVLWRIKTRLSTAQLRRAMRITALLALALSWVAMQQGESFLATALLVLLWGILLAVICAREITRRR